ncbi:hypothetical protein B0H13DRAFT_1919088 [Mycena leptocephala]|nr:hypothetical protein B0H13DRAFT_1919088 [Mycena leptocephala]
MKSPSRSGKEGPSRLNGCHYLCFLAGGWVMANALYTSKEVITVKLDRDTTKALGAFFTGRMRRTWAHHPSLPFVDWESRSHCWGVVNFNMGVSNCDQGLWAPVPGRRSLGLNYDNATIAIADHDPTSDHPAHRFITNYLGALERNSTFGHGAHIGFVHYARTAPSRHRLVIQPSGNAIGRRQDNSDNDGGSVSYEWTDFGSEVTRATAIRATTILLQVALRATFRPSDPAHITYTRQRSQQHLLHSVYHPDDVYEVGQIQTQAGTDRVTTRSASSGIRWSSAPLPVTEQS